VHFNRRVWLASVWVMARNCELQIAIAVGLLGDGSLTNLNKTPGFFLERSSCFPHLKGNATRRGLLNRISLAFIHCNTMGASNSKAAEGSSGGRSASEVPLSVR